MKRITKVTVTGADDSTDISDLFEIQREYPFVEFAILLSNRYSLSSGRNRFPSKEWLQKLIKANNESSTKLNLSGHICGKWTTKFLLGEWPDFNEIDRGFEDHFQRFQINTHAEFHQIDFLRMEVILNWLDFRFKKVIFQVDNVNDILPELERRRYSGKNLEALFDLSHGAGVLPTEWPTIIKGINCGYAGGLGPENVQEQIQKILKVTEDKTFWIDAETKLRSDGDRVFDLEKVTAFLENAKQNVI